MTFPKFGATQRATAPRSSWPPLVIVMMQPRHHVTWWRSWRTRVVIFALCCLVLVQYFYGSSIYDIKFFDTKIFYGSLAGQSSVSSVDAPAGATANLAASSKELFRTNAFANVTLGFKEPDLSATSLMLTTLTAGSVTAVPSSLEDDRVTSAETTTQTTDGELELIDDTTTVQANESSSSEVIGESYNSTMTEGPLAVVKLSPAKPDLPQCSLLPPVLVGPIAVWFDKPTLEEVEAMYPWLEPGGHSKPENCTSRHRVAIIIPYRDRSDQLRVFLHNMHDLMHKQQLDYAIYIIEQIPDQTFNRAKLMNIGFAEARKYYDWQCVIFHDVDLLPEDDRNIYSCPEQPRHMSVAIDKFNYKLPYTDIFGGITALTIEQFTKLNGFSNDFWGWGGEDDEMASRVKYVGFQISRYPYDIARYKMMKHAHEGTNPVNKCRYNLMYKYKQRMYKDGLNSLRYTVKERELNKLYTRITVDLLETEERKRLDEEHLC